MALPSSGQISISSIRTEIGTSNGSLRTLSSLRSPAGSIPDSISEFWGYSSWSASGGNSVVDSGGYRIHTFTESDVFSVIGSRTVEIIAVGGGGAARFRNAGGANGLDGSGGGGAGGYVVSSPTVSSNLTIVIGAGGRAINVGSQDQINTQGGDTTITGGATITAYGGGRGGLFNNDTTEFKAGDGGSGGGRGRGVYGGVGGLGILGQGSNGGWRTGYQNGYGPGGGGGAAAAGGDGFTGNRGGNGGAGQDDSWNGTTYYAGGGGGSSYFGQAAGSGGTGGGGNGKTYPLSGGELYGDNGTPNTGGGGGAEGGGGGSGIVKIRYVYP
jgi:hypothetical protein